MDAEIGSRPFGGGGEGDPTHGLPGRFQGKLGRHGLCRFVVRLLIVIKGGQNLLNILIGEPFGLNGENIGDFHGRLCDGTRFVHAKNIHMSQRFDAVHILHQNPLTCQLQGTDGNSNAGQKIEAFRNHADQGGHGGLHRAAESQRLHLTDEQDDAHGDEGDTNNGDELGQGVHHLRLGRADIATGLRSQLCRVAVGADMGQLSLAATGDHKTSGFKHVARVFDDGVGLAGEQRFIHLHLTLADYRVGTNLIACDKFHNIIPNQLVCRKLPAFAVTDDPQLARGDQGQLIHGPFGADLLENADDRIGYGDNQKGQILKRTDDDERCCKNDKDQVEEGKDILLDDLTLRLGVAGGGDVPQAVFLPLSHLLGGQTQVDGGFHHRKITDGMHLLFFLFHG